MILVDRYCHWLMPGRARYPSLHTLAFDAYDLLWRKRGAKNENSLYSPVIAMPVWLCLAVVIAVVMMTVMTVMTAAGVDEGARVHGTVQGQDGGDRMSRMEIYCL